MNRPYNYLFKFIIVGDTSNDKNPKKVLGNLVYCYNMSIRISDLVMKQQ